MWRALWACGGFREVLTSISSCDIVVAISAFGRLGPVSRHVCKRLWGVRVPGLTPEIGLLGTVIAD